MIVPQKWLLLLYGLPTRKGAARVRLWRQLKRCGALSLKTSAYLLPDKPERHERLQWLAQQVRDAGGEATLIRVTEIEGMSHEQIVRQFNDARGKDYSSLLKALARFLQGNQKRPPASFGADLKKFQARFQEIRGVDYFACPIARDVEILLARAANGIKSRSITERRLVPGQFKGKTWLTRPRPEIDRVGSAWLIRKFIDPKARFIFSGNAADHPHAIPYDMSEGELTHHGEDCTFETLLKRFRISDSTAGLIGEMIHDADLEDEKFKRYECFGLDRVFKGWAKLGLGDQEILSKGFECFDALHALLKRG